MTGTIRVRVFCDKCGNPEHVPLPPQARRPCPPLNSKAPWQPPVATAP
jgi:hypothetical protein